jgi:putative spermidine/putrescine transport system permease protein
MISWIPFLGREGIFNNALMSVGIVDQPLEFLLFSDFAVILTYVNLFTLFMIVPIFNAMVKINPNVIEAAVDAGASQVQVLWNVIIPLTRTGIALGTIFVMTLVMGDFFIVRVMSGGQSTSVVSAMKNNIDQLFYPQAAAMAVLLIGVVVFMVSAILRVVDVRAELAK